MDKLIDKKFPKDYKKDKKNKEDTNMITKAPHCPIMLEKSMLFNKVKTLLLSQKNNNEIDEIYNKLKDLDLTNIIIKNSKQIHIKTNKNRVKMLKYLADIFNGIYIDKPSHISSAGYVELNNKVKLVVKPDSKYSAGILNEKILIDKINELCSTGPINIKFISNDRVFKCLGVKNCIGTGTDTKNRKKADLVLQGIKNYPISLKKDNAEIWESADKYAGNKARDIIYELLELGKIELIKSEHDIYKIKPNVAFIPTLEEKHDVIFGNDILPNGAVIEKSFDLDNIINVNDDGWIEIPVNNIITNIYDLDDYRDVIFLIRNDSSRNSKYINIPGLRVLAVYKKRLNKNILVYDKKISIS